MISYYLHLDIKKEYSLILFLADSLHKFLNPIDFIIKIMNFFCYNLDLLKMNKDWFYYIINFRDSLFMND